MFEMMQNENAVLVTATPEEIEAFLRDRTEHAAHQCSTNPLVSVCLPTYNHCNYLRKAVESVLSQKTDFEIEVILGDDASTDGTQEICAEYSRKYPERVRLLRARENLGKYTGNCRLNFLRLLGAVAGNT